MVRVDLLALIGRDTSLRRTCAREGGEYAGPCPLCRRGVDRFKVWPQIERWACLGAKAGRSGCDVGGDAIDYLRRRDGVGYREACARLGLATAGGGRRPVVAGGTLETGKMETGTMEEPEGPNPLWQARGAEWAARCAALLWQPPGARARTYLQRRGLEEAVLRAHDVGYNPHDVRETRALWGLPPQEHSAPDRWGGRGGGTQHRLPRGISLPWWVEGKLWRFNLRRPLSRAQIAAGQAKYIGPPGFANGLYNAGALEKGDKGTRKPVVLVEGELDALTVAQACGDLVAAVATGSTGGGRRARWVAALAQAPCVLVAFDVDANGAGDQAAGWWLHALPRARRWRPLLHDVNSLPDPDLVRAWVQRGLAHAPAPVD